MKVSRLNICILLSLLLLLFTTTVTAQSDNDDEPDDYDVKARVGRISLINGQVNLKRSGNQDWEPVKLNYPLVEGDTIGTDKDSRIEIQIDARNFVRLTANSVLRIVTLRDEGIALGVVEGTAIIRLARFDRDKEYFEIDAPKATVAAEKTGLYRVDAPREGRVRVTIRDGGSARIYSDTSGFALRDGRSAELSTSGNTAGDWEFFVAAALDANDEWVEERERFLAQRLKYDTKYYDEYVWGAEDLEAYGDWSYSNDFGWVWRPHGSVINAYHDWAPYRHGSWTWVQPYGWTWVGYEPWGWAPYHYGRWVYHNNYWVWVPRSQFYKKRSWWRPALVAFANFSFSFGDNICWYPLSYYQRDPHSRYYRRNNRRYDGGYRHGDRDRDNDRRRRYDNDRNWRGVTHVPRGEFGNPQRPGQAVDETVARRVREQEPFRGGDLPRARFHRVVPEEGPERGGRIRPVIQIPERTTGAAERSAGAPMEGDLRRNRVYRGRNPRQDPPATQPTTNTAETTTPATVPAATTPMATQPQPTGPVERPRPRFEPRSEPRSEPRETPRESRPAPRSEPRSEPRAEPRSESRPARNDPPPRSESPRREGAPRPGKPDNP